ncbi:MAG: DUF4340 domain-containing protein [Myxococcota bacterium]
MTRLQRTLLAAGVALLGVGALIWISTTAPSSTERAQARYDAERPFSFGPDDVAWGTVTSTHGSFRFERDEVFGWRIAEPYSWPGHAEPLEAVLVRVAGLAATREVYSAPSTKDLAQSGLNDPRVRIELALASGERHGLSLGKLHPLESTVYARADEGAVFVAEPSVLWSSLRPIDEFRNKRVLPFDRAQIETLGIEREDGRGWTLRTSTSGLQASIDGGPFHPADEGQAAVAMAAAFLRLEADRWLVDGAHDLESALETMKAPKWRTAFTLSVRHPSGLVRRATVGVAASKNTPEAKPLAWIDGSLMQLYPPPAKELLTLDPFLLRDRSLAEFRPKEVSKVFLIFGLEFASLTRAEDAWRLERKAGSADASQEHRLASDAVEPLLKKLSTLKGVELVSEEPSAEELGRWLLQPPSRRFGFQGRGGETLGVITIGDLSDTGGFYVRGQDGPVYTVPRKVLEDLPLRVTDFAQ